MCGRYNLITDIDALMLFFSIQESLLKKDAFPPRYNIAPSQNAPIVTIASNRTVLSTAKWGLVPFWSKEPSTRYSTINARAEKIAHSAVYRKPFKSSRCLVPATGFYEWKKEGERKQPYNIVPKTGGLMALAGVFDVWRQGQDDELISFSIITTQADKSVKSIHERMPVILAPDNFSAWLNPATASIELEALMQNHVSEILRPYRVSAVVNNPRNDSPQCIEPV